MAFERHNGAEEFETMLRHHLIRSAGQSPACAGFDAEKANGYLEGGLSPIARSRYDEHLVGCASCRRAIIELRRLIPEVDLAPVSVQPQNRFVEWWSGIRKGFTAPRWSPLGWGLQGWGMTAAAGALAILLAVVLIPRQRQESVQTARSMPQESSPLPNPAPATAGGVISVAQPGQTEAARNQQVAVNSAAPQSTPINGRARTAEMSPAASVAPQVMMAAALNQNSISGRISGPAGGAIAEAQITLVEVGSNQQPLVTRTDENGKFNFSEIPSGNYQLNIQATGFLPLQLSDLHPESSREMMVQLHTKPIMDQSLIATVPAPPSATPPPPAADKKIVEADSTASGRTDNTARKEAAVAANSGEKNSPKSSGRRLSFIPSIRPKKDKDKEEKSTADAAAKAGDDETVRVMTHRVRDKVFRLENGREGGRWIDQEFKPEFLPRRERLTRGSAEFERVLTENPDLKPFFDLGRVIVVWKGTVYEILK